MMCKEPHDQEHLCIYSILHGGACAQWKSLEKHTELKGDTRNRLPDGFVILMDGKAKYFFYI